MRIATILYETSTASAGCYHYTALLLNALSNIDGVFVDLYLTKNDKHLNYLKSYGLNIVHFNGIKFLKFYTLHKVKNPFILLKNIIKKLLNKYINIKYNNYLLNTFNKKNYDLLFYPWPYYINPIICSLPIFFIPHDFAISHFFGGGGKQFWTKTYFKHYKEKLSMFFKYGHAIVSSNFIKNDFILHFSNKINIDVVYLSKFNNYNFLKTEQINLILRKYNINDDYIIWPSNMMLHKNLNQLIGAYYYIKQKYNNMKLILTGNGTEEIILKSNSHYYADQLLNENDNWDILGLGQLFDFDFSAILQGARAVINTSLCEAGNGSGLDAWSLGIPVAQSDIPAFNEQLEFLGVKAETFDPKNDKSIADAILRILDNPKQANENAIISKEAINKYSWDDIAKKYYSIFLRYKNMD